MYTGRLWTMRQYAGFGTAQETNRRFRQLLAAGQMGLSTAFDLPTQMGYDSDHPMAQGEVGRVGVAIDTVEDLAELFREIPLDRVSTSMTINATAAILLAMYVVVGEEQGVPRAKLTGTVQNDVLKEYIARGTYIYPAQPSLRLVADIFRFVSDEGMSFNPISISGYHMREAGATAVQEVGFTLANALEYVRVAVEAGLAVDSLRPPALLLLRQPQRSVRGGGQVPRRAPALGPAGSRAIRGGRRDRATAVPYPDRRRHAAGAAAAHQRRAGDGAGARGRAGRHAVAAHQRLRRGAGAADGGVCHARAPNPADHRLRERRARAWSIRWPGATTSRA